MLLVTLIPVGAFASDTSQSASKKTVKIGYYEDNNFQAGASEDAVKSGYSYEYLQRLQPYTNWEYEYVYGEYGDLYNKLLSGEIDILTGLAYSDERASIINYPESPMGETEYSFLKQTQRTDITSDAKTIAGKRIGALSGAMVGVAQKYLETNNISAEIVTYDSLDDRDRALIDGTVDLTIVEGTTTTAMEGIEVFADAGEAGYYAVVTKSRTDILADLNTAQASLFKASPNIISDLSEKWFRTSAVSTALSESERSWIKTHTTFTVGYYNDFLPYSATDEAGNATGIVKDVVPELFSLLGIDVDIKYIGYNTYDEMLAALSNHEIDVMFPAYSEYWSAEQSGIMPTDALISTYYDLVYRGNYPDVSTAVIAIPSSNGLIQACQKINLPDAHVKYYQTINDCLRAVNAGEADATLVNGLRTSTLLSTSGDYADLHSVQIAGDASLGFAASRSDSGTIEIMNHMLGLIDPDYALTQTYHYQDQDSVTLQQILREYWWVIVLAILVVVAIIVFFVLRELSRNKRYLEQERRQAHELEAANEEKLERIEEITALNEELEERQAQLEEATSEQEAQLEEITSLNEELGERQAQLEEVAAEQEAQIEEITALNEELEASKDSVSEAYGMIEGLSQEYHTIWVVSKETSRMRLVRSSGNSTIKNAVQMGKDMPEFDTGFNAYIETYVEPEDRERMHREIAFAEVLRQLEEHPDETYRVNYLRRADDGTVGYHQIAFVNADVEGGHRRFVYGFRDVDALVRSEAARIGKAESFEAASAIHDALGSGDWRMDFDDTGELASCTWSARFRHMLGFESEEDFPNRISSWRNRIHPDDKDEVWNSYWDAVNDPSDTLIYDPTSRVMMKSGEYRWFRATGKVTRRPDGTPKSFYGMFLDVTDAVTHEQELAEARDAANAANDAKTSFLFNMSHDIRTPMNAIIGFTNLLEKHQDEPDKREDYLRKIRDSSTVLLSIINNVLEMARIEKGTFEVDETPWLAEQFNDTLYSVFSEMMSEKNIEFTRQIEVENSYVYCDPIKLREIFINILSNAYKYTEPGGKVNMRLEEIPSDRPGFVLYRTTITDTGIGMAKDFLPHLFEEFAREHTFTETKVEGTGLGMPIVKRLVEILEGTIEVDSELGVGTTFVVTLPHRIADSSALVEHEDVEVDPALFEGKCILLAEDNDLNAEIAMEILGEAGFVLERAEDGAVAVRMLEESEAGRYDVILMDVQMPNMNGYEATRAIRVMEDQTKANIPILAMTANAFEEDKREALRSGMDGHIAKPIDVPELMEALASILA